MSWGKFYAIAIPIVGLVAWVEWNVNPFLVLLVCAWAGVITFLVLKGWIRRGGGSGGDMGGGDGGGG